jgi:hypothetical protein
MNEREMTKEDWKMMHDLMELQEQIVIHGAAYVRAKLREAAADAGAAT